ncbi:preprotein translocase subunit SecG [Altererythrobacter sp. CAU 1778]
MNLFLFLTVIQAIVAAALVGVVLMQRSEGGGLGMGGSPSGMLSARGAADFLTRMTTILAVLFVGLSILLAGLATNVAGGRDIDDTLDRSVATQAPVDPLAGEGLDGDPPVDPTQEAAENADPLAGAAE